VDSFSAALHRLSGPSRRDHVPAFHSIRTVDALFPSISSQVFFFPEQLGHSYFQQPSPKPSRRKNFFLPFPSTAVLRRQVPFLLAPLPLLSCFVVALPALLPPLIRSICPGAVENSGNESFPSPLSTMPPSALSRHPSLRMQGPSFCLTKFEADSVTTKAPPFTPARRRMSVAFGFYPLPPFLKPGDDSSARSAVTASKRRLSSLSQARRQTSLFALSRAQDRGSSTAVLRDFRFLETPVGRSFFFAGPSDFFSKHGVPSRDSPLERRDSVCIFIKEVFLRCASF